MPSPSQSSRIVRRIELTPPALQTLDRYLEESGRTKVFALSRLVEWFCAEPVDVREAIMSAGAGTLDPKTIIGIYSRQIEKQGHRIGVATRSGGARLASASSGGALPAPT